MTFRLRIARIEIIEVEAEEIDVDDLHDSFVDDVLDGQDSTHETSDSKFEYVPRELVSLEIVLEEKS
jgi:hypothetical protein